MLIWLGCCRSILEMPYRMPTPNGTAETFFSWVIIS